MFSGVFLIEPGKRGRLQERTFRTEEGPDEETGEKDVEEEVVDQESE